MVISSKINEYIEKSKMQGRFLRWDKSVINVYTTPISAPVSNKEFLYSEIDRAVLIWNGALKSSGINLLLNTINTPVNADIIIHWVKVGRVYEGMCKYPSVINGVLKKVSIDIGLENQFSGKNTTNESIFFVMLHELGHAIGLGHGVEIDDVMYVPHQKNVSKPSENDLYVLKQIYCK
jgi:hypothetical protein